MDCKIYAYLMLDGLKLETNKEINIDKHFTIKSKTDAACDPSVSFQLQKGNRDLVYVYLGALYVLEYEDTIDYKNLKRINEELIYSRIQAAFTTLQLFKSEDVGSAFGYIVLGIGVDHPETQITAFRSFRLGTHHRFLLETYSLKEIEIDRLRSFWSEIHERVFDIESTKDFPYLPLLRFTQLSHNPSLENRLVETMISFEMIFSEHNDTYQTQLYATCFLSQIGEDWATVWHNLQVGKRIRNDIVHGGHVRKEHQSVFPSVTKSLHDYLRKVLVQIIEEKLTKREILDRIQLAIKKASN